MRALFCALVAALALCGAAHAEDLSRYPEPKFKSVTMGAGTLSSPYGDLNVTKDPFRVQVGDFPIGHEVGSSSPSTQAITGALELPAGTYSGTPTWPDAALAGYCLNHNTSKFCLGIYTAAQIGAPGSFAMGGNFSTVNCAGGCKATEGLDFRNMTGIEVDTNVYSIGGKAPTGNVFGIVSQLNASIAPSAAFNAFNVVGSGIAPIGWGAAYATEAGGAYIGLSLGPKAKTGPSDSQNVNLTALGGDGKPVGSTQYLNSVGTLVTTTAGANGSGQTQAFGVSYPQQILSGGGSGVGEGFKINNPGVGAGTGADVILQTGSAGAYTVLSNADGGYFNVITGSGLQGINLQPGNGPIVASGPVGLLVPTGSVREATQHTPRSSSSPCLPGDHAWDNGYEYRCVAPNTWKRAALSAF